MNDLKNLFLLDPGVVFLNHGSFGACPKPVFDAYQDWQRRLEYQPVRFLVDELADHLEEARRWLGSYVGAEKDDLAYVPNATFGINVVARSLQLGPGDEVLTTNHEYGACHNAWTFLSRKNRFRYIRQAIPLPVMTEDIVERLAQADSTMFCRRPDYSHSHCQSGSGYPRPGSKNCSKTLYRQ